MDDSDLLEIGIINAAHREVILKAAQRFQKFTPKLTKAEIKTISVPEWLSMLKLDQYRESFQRNGMSELRKVHNIWELELETMLEIDKSGYRRRIMYSLSDYNRESILIDDDVSVHLERERERERRRRSNFIMRLSINVNIFAVVSVYVFICDCYKK